MSQKLVQGLRDQSPQSLRIPAEELEQAVIGRLISFLQDGMEILILMDQHGLEDAVATHAVLENASSMSNRLGNITQSHYASTVIPLLNGIIERVTVSANQIEVHLILGSLIKQAVTTSHASPEACTNIDWSRLTHTLILPIQIKRSGLAVRLMVEPAEHRIKRIADPKLLKLLSKAHIWFDRLTQNNVLMQQIAEQEHVSRSYVSRVIRLAFLSPDIVKFMFSF